MFASVVPLAATVLATILIYYKWAFSYWNRRGLESLQPSIPFGDAAQLFKAKCCLAEHWADMYSQLKARGLQHGGVYTFARPFYIPVAPELVKNILQRDFHHFVDRGFYVNEEVDPLTGHLFILEGGKWKNLRAKLTATFTSGKMKMMFETMALCAKELDTYMDRVSGPVDIKEILARFTTDVISSCAFGLESHCLQDGDTPLRYYGKRHFQNTAWENARDLFALAMPISLLRAIKFKAIKPDVEDFMLNLVKQTVEYREKNDIYRKDFLHLLLQLKNRGQITDDETIERKTTESGLTLNELAAQVFVFFAAGYETSSTAMTFTLYELSLNQTVQEKLRREIQTVLGNEDVTYEALARMTYMDQVVNESLRKYPPLAFLNRKCTKAYDVPGTDIHLEEGTMVVVPILGIHRDPEYYPEPSRFDPERFSEENRKKRLPFTWMPFGEGPRNCIGLRFGLLQTKIGLATLLRNYRVTLNEKTEVPLKLDPKTFTTNTEKEVWLNVTKLN